MIFRIKKKIFKILEISREKAINYRLIKIRIILKRKYYSFFVLDSLSKGLSVFYNKDLK